jgi:hypothetical protein
MVTLNKLKLLITIKYSFETYTKPIQKLLKSYSLLENNHAP